MRKKDFNGKVKTLVHNVNDSIELGCSLLNVIKEQANALGIRKEIKSYEAWVRVDFVVNGKHYKTKGFHKHKVSEDTYGWGN